MRRVLPFLAGTMLLITFFALDARAAEQIDVTVIEQIKTEAFEHSQVMDIASWLTDVYGPRLTGSPNTKAASDWAVTKMRSWGLLNAHLEQWNPYESGIASEQWGPLDRGWTSEQFTFWATAPQSIIINAVPSVYSPSTNGCIVGPVIRFDVHSFADMQRRFSGKLKGAFLLMDAARPTPAHFEPQAKRLTDADLHAMAEGKPSQPHAERAIVEKTYDALRDASWLVDEGVGAMLFVAPGDGGTIFMAGRGGAGSRKKNDLDPLPSVKVSAESYGRIARILEKNIPVTLELNMRNTFHEHPDVFNIIAEIPGSDPKLKDEVVLIGAHFDSWTFGTGATDDGANSAVMMEAMRILNVLNLHPRRTIRIGLWTGEEQGALGSNAYVQRHLRDWQRYSQGDISTTKPEYDSFSVYFNLDAGTGKIRGIHQQGNEAVGPIFDAWMKPFKELGMKTITISDIGGGDNHAFTRVGLPSFGFIQDPIEYTTRTWHSSADVYERLQPEDLKFNSAVLASFAWQAALREEKLPRVAPRP